MKHVFIILLIFMHSVDAAQASTYETSLYTGTVFLFLLLLAMVIVLMKKSSQDKQTIQEKEEKITRLHQVQVEKEHTHLQKEQEFGKEILKLTHSIENMELRLKEGTKNQVVNKIEELQNKRQAVQSRLSSLRQGL